MRNFILVNYSIGERHLLFAGVAFAFYSALGSVLRICNPQQGSMLPFIWGLKPKGMKIWCPSSDEPHQLFFHVVGYGVEAFRPKIAQTIILVLKIIEIVFGKFGISS
uniref:hypothetical protein n=1 Tax=Segatella copri TaxID=165179 RepID=UPI002626A426